ncbi:MAG: extracellular solute-binding protein, partial [Oscillospiraceae bacterium]|nr:extracellular solute-binding protein [Oscillospiraceae bacterium]
DKSYEISYVPVHMYVNKNDELYLLKHTYDSDFPTKDRTNDEVNTIDHYDRDGNLIETIHFSLPDTDEKLKSESRYRDYDEFIVREDGTIVCGYYNVVDFYNSDGTFREEYKIENNSGMHLVAGKNDYYAVAEGSEYYKTSGKIYRIGEKDDSLELISDFNFKVENQLFSGDEKYDFYVSEPEGIYGYKISENKMYEIINWIDSDMDATPAAVAMLDSNRMLCGVNDYLLSFDPNNLDFKISISMIERVSDEKLKIIQSRDTVTIACDSISKPVMKKISEFNRTHEDCRITVREYGKYSDCGISGFNQFNRDLITGIIPDIVINSGTIDMKRYEELGMFTDLNDYIDGENGINRNDYYDSVFKVFSGNGVQYEIPLFFEINEIVGRKSDTGDISSATFDELNRMSEEKRLFSGDSRDIVFDLIKKNITEFVDFSSYKCDFDNESFISLLNIINRESKEESNGKFDDFENKKCVFYCCELNSYYITELNGIKEDLVYIDYPSSGTEGTLISTSFSAAIAEKSENKEYAWEFLKVLLSDDIQDTRNYEFFPEIPVKRSEAEKVLGNNYEMISSMAESASRAVIYDSSINKIIDEQMEIYLNDGQSAEETAKNIQNKVSVYLREIK